MEIEMSDKSNWRNKIRSLILTAPLPIASLSEMLLLLTREVSGLSSPSDLWVTFSVPRVELGQVPAIPTGLIHIPIWL